MTRMLIVGLDGATFDLIHPWVSEGRLPVMGGLLANGCSAPLRSVPNMNSAPAWSSFATGLNPGKHGVFHFTERLSGTYRWRAINGSHRRGLAFWGLLSRSGHRVGVINVPMTYPARPLNGFLIAGLDTPGVDSPGFTYPQTLAAEMQAAVGEYIVEPGLPGLMSAGQYDEAIRMLKAGVRQRLAHALWLADHFQPDLLLVVFTATDTAQHFFWHAMDPTHPAHTPQEKQRFGQVICDIYATLDQAIGQLMEATVPEIVMLVSDHGSGLNQRGYDYLRPWLVETGMLAYVQRESSFRRLGRRAGERAYSWINHRFSREVKLRLARRLPGLRARVESAIRLGGIDWPRSQAFCTGASDDLYINLAGREPEGIVRPGDQYEKVRTRLVEWLSETVDPVSGAPAVCQVKRREEVYWGPEVHRSPDLLVEWRRERVLGGLLTPGFQAVTAKSVPDPIQTGGHRRDGVLVLAGRDISSHANLQSPSILDVAPTVLYLYGQAVPSDADGRVLTEAIAPEFLAAQPLQQGGSVLDDRSEALQEYEAEDGTIVEERLRGLGYLA